MVDRHFGQVEEDDVLSSATDESGDESDDETRMGHDRGMPKGNRKKGRKGRVGFLFGNVDRKLDLQRNDTTVQYIEEEDGAREHIEQLRKTITQHTMLGGVVATTATATATESGDASTIASQRVARHSSALDFEDQNEMLAIDDDALDLPSNSAVMITGNDKIIVTPTLLVKESFNLEDYDMDDVDDENKESDMFDPKKDNMNLNVLYSDGNGEAVLKFSDLFHNSESYNEKKSNLKYERRKITKDKNLPVIAVMKVDEGGQETKSALTEVGVFTWPQDFLKELPRSYFVDNDGESDFEMRQSSQDSVFKIRATYGFEVSSNESKLQKFTGFENWEDRIDWIGCGVHTDMQDNMQDSFDEKDAHLNNVVEVLVGYSSKKVGRVIEKSYFGETLNDPIQVSKPLGTDTQNSKSILPKSKVPFRKATAQLQVKISESIANQIRESGLQIKEHMKNLTGSGDYLRLPDADRSIERATIEINQEHAEDVEKEGKTSTINIVEQASKSVAPYMKLRWHNEELEEGDWLQSIIWNESSLKHRRCPLKLDLNDSHMIFEFDAEDDEAGDSYREEYYDSLRKTSAACLLVRKEPELTKDESNFTGKKYEAAWDFEGMRQKHLEMSISRAEAINALKTNRVNDGIGAVAIKTVILSHALPALLLTTTEKFLTKSDRDYWHQPTLLYNPIDMYSPLVNAKVTIPTGLVDKKSSIKVKFGKRGIVRLRLRSLSRFSPSPRTREESVMFVPSAESISVLLKRWMEGFLPDKIRDISEEEVQKGLIDFYILTSSKTKVKSVLETPKDQKTDVEKFTSSAGDKLLQALSQCNEYNVVCIDRPQVELLPTKELLSEDNVKRDESILAAHNELSAASGGRIYLCEYLEKEPYYIPLPGMRLQLCTFYRKRSMDDEGITLEEARSSKNFQPSINNVDDELLGKTIFLEPGMRSPFAPFADVVKGQFIGAVKCEMFTAPAVKHNSRGCDFLLVRSASGKWKIREVQATIAVGQQIPRKKPIFLPNSREMNEYAEKRLKVFVYRIIETKKADAEIAEKNISFVEKEFNSAERNKAASTKNKASALSFDLAQLRFEIAEENRNEARITVRDRELIGRSLKEFAYKFPNQKPELLRKRLRNSGLVFRTNVQKQVEGWVVGDGFVMPSETEIRKLLGPEEVCIYESMQVFRDRLRKHGIYKLYNAPELMQEDYIMRLMDAKFRPGLKEMIDVLQRVPWKLTQNFFDASSGAMQLAVTGNGDPSGHGCLFSFCNYSSAKQGKKSKRSNISVTEKEYRQKCYSVWKSMLEVLSTQSENDDDLLEDETLLEDAENKGASDDDFLDDFMEGSDEEDEEEIAKAQAAFDKIIGDGNKFSMDKDANNVKEERSIEESTKPQEPTIRRVRCVVYRTLDDGSVKEDVDYIYDRSRMDRLLDLKKSWEKNQGNWKVFREDDEDEMAGQAKHREHRKHLEQKRRERKRKALGLPPPTKGPNAVPRPKKPKLTKPKICKDCGEEGHASKRDMACIEYTPPKRKTSKKVDLGADKQSEGQINKVVDEQQMGMVPNSLADVKPISNVATDVFEGSVGSNLSKPVLPKLKSFKPIRNPYSVVGKQENNKPVARNKSIRFTQKTTDLQSEDEEEEYLNPAAQRRARGKVDPSKDHIVLNGIIKEVIEKTMYPHGVEVKICGEFAIFHERVNTSKKKGIPDYHVHVPKKDHVFLTKILTNAKNTHYKTVEAFQSDVSKIVLNAEAYHRVDPTTGLPVGVLCDPSIIELAHRMKQTIFDAFSIKLDEYDQILNVTS